MAVDQHNPKSQGESKRDIEPILVDSKTAASMCGISVAMWYRLLSQGRIGPQKIRLASKCVRFSIQELREWARAGAPARSQWLRTGRGPK